MNDLEMLGKRIKLNESYKPEEYVFEYGREWSGFEYGIITEIISHEFDREMRREQVKNVSAHLFDREGRLYLCGKREEGKSSVPVPTFVDFHISEFMILTDNMLGANA